MPNALSQCVERPSLPGTSSSSEPWNRWFEEPLIPRFKRAGCSRIGEPGDEKVLRPSVKGSGGRKAGPLRVAAWTFSTRAASLCGLREERKGLSPGRQGKGHSPRPRSGGSGETGIQRLMPMRYSRVVSS